eukprot:IDg9202t1
MPLSAVSSVDFVRNAGAPLLLCEPLWGTLPACSSGKPVLTSAHIGWRLLHCPAGWRWDIALQERACAMSGAPELSLWVTDAEISFVSFVAEVRWARRYVTLCDSPLWCYSLARFDERLVSGMPGLLVCISSAATVELRARYVVVGTLRRYIAGTRARHRGDYLSSLQGPLSFRVCARLSRDTPRDRGSIEYFLWDTVMSQWAANVANAVMREDKSAWNGGESVDTGRLWWFLLPHSRH